ncbi:MAG TPA: YaiO family outer membrane beta-barrel protein [Candidatus Limnocylindrales bacterium]|nr:YaiO family outer membrane beta-barrel protein [Candidatus Limnocylindrales bacterium]
MRARKFAVMALLAGAAGLFGQPAEKSGPPAIPYPPVRFEAGGYGMDFGKAGGWWRGEDALVLIRASRWFVPEFSVDSRTSDAGSAQYYSFLSYANWTANFFTTQAIGGSTGNGPVLFPRFRYDVKAWWKVPPRRKLVAGIGYTQFRFANGSRGQILNPGVVYYSGRWVIDAEGFANRNEPGGFWSGSGLAAVQRGQEGRHWAGVTVGAGRQVYRALSTTPVDVRFASVSVDAFYRQWLTRHFGFVVSAGYEDAFHNFRRTAISGHLFFEF